MTQVHLPATIDSAAVMSAADFEATITDAQAKAQTLKRIVESQGLFAMISGKKYLEVEAWQTIARAYGMTARTDWTRPIEGGGWEARVSVIDGGGNEVGAAETECGTAGDSPWDKRNSAAVRSMAQTRAVSKALRSVLSWVVVLAGYQATPASEMPVEDAGDEILCPVHNVAFFQTANMRTPAHKMDNGPWCNFSAALWIDETTALMGELGWDKQQVNDLCAEVANKAFNDLHMSEITAVIETMRELVLAAGAPATQERVEEPEAAEEAE